MDVTHGDTVTKEEVRMWRDKAFALQKQVAQLTAVKDAAHSLLDAFYDTGAHPGLYATLDAALAAVDKGDTNV